EGRAGDRHHVAATRGGCDEIPAVRGFSSRRAGFPVYGCEAGSRLPRCRGGAASAGVDADRAGEGVSGPRPDGALLGGGEGAPGPLGLRHLLDHGAGRGSGDGAAVGRRRADGGAAMSEAYSVQEALERLAAAEGATFTTLFEHGSLAVEIYAPKGHDPQ